jgi:hypothetical protein
MTTLTDEQKSTLNAEIATDPEGKGYAALLPNQPGHVVDLLNEQTETMYKPHMVTERTIMELDPTMARSIFTKFRAFATQDILVEKAVGFLQQSAGLDGGHPNCHWMIDQLSAVPAPDGFTPEEARALKNLSLLPASRAEVLGLPYMTEELLRNL